MAKLLEKNYIKAITHLTDLVCEMKQEVIITNNQIRRYEKSIKDYKIKLEALKQ